MYRQCNEPLGFPNHVCNESTQPEAEEGRWDDFFSEITFYNEFPAGPRKDATFYTVFKQKKGGVTVDVPWQTSAQKHPYYAKFKDQTYTLANPFGYDDGSSLNVTFIRFAETLLAYAEAQCMSEITSKRSSLDIPLTATPTKAIVNI